MRSFLTHYVSSLRFVHSFHTAVNALLPGLCDINISFWKSKDGFLRKKSKIHSVTSFRFIPPYFASLGQLHYATLSSFISFSFSGKAIKLTRHTAVFTQSLSLRSPLHAFVPHSLRLFTPFRSFVSYSCDGSASRRPQLLRLIRKEKGLVNSRRISKSRMNREVHVRFCEEQGVKFPLLTRLLAGILIYWFQNRRRLRL
jgi:hypothetical protein